MKKYLKPDAQYVAFDIEERIMDNVFDPSWNIGEDDEEGLE